MNNRFDPATLQQIADIEEVDIEPGGDVPTRTTIWIVVVDGDVYVRSVHGERGLWYQALRQHPDGALYLGEKRLPIRAVHVTDDKIIARVSDEYVSNKYRESEWSPPMVKPETLPTTLRLEPR
jgi:hypothetical protein